MKKLIVLTLCLALLVACLAACGRKKPVADATTTVPQETTTVPQETATEEPTVPEEVVRINYKGLDSVAFTEVEMEDAEERPCDFTAPAGDTTMYIYNNVTLDTIVFTQVQYTFSETSNRISCTYTGEDTQSAMDSYSAAMTAAYGEPSQTTTGDGIAISTWRDEVTTNYVQLMQLNETTVQLVYYLSEGAQ